MIFTTLWQDDCNFTARSRQMIMTLLHKHASTLDQQQQFPVL